MPIFLWNYRAGGSNFSLLCHKTFLISLLFLFYPQWVPSTSLAPWNDCAQSTAQLCLLCIVKCFPVSSAKSFLSDTRMAFWLIGLVTGVHVHCVAIAMKSCFPKLCSSTKILLLTCFDHTCKVHFWSEHCRQTYVPLVLSSSATVSHGSMVLNVAYSHSCV